MYPNLTKLVVVNIVLTLAKIMCVAETLLGLVVVVGVVVIVKEKRV